MIPATGAAARVDDARCRHRKVGVHRHVRSCYQIDDTHTIRDVIAEKIEGMAWGPDLEDGRRVLYVVSDNDIYPDLPTQIYAVAIDTSAAGANIGPGRSS